MAKKEEVKNNTVTLLEQAIKKVIKDNKLKGSIHYDELTNLVVTPYELDADQIDDVIMQVEDGGVSVVGDDGGPTDRQILAKEKDKKAAEEQEDLTAPAGC